MLTEARAQCLSSKVLIVTSQAGVFSINESSRAWELTTGVSGKTLASTSRFVTVLLSLLIYLLCSLPSQAD